MKANHLRTEYLENPIGLGNPRPRFSWLCEGGVTQTAYQITAVRDGEKVWDTGKVQSSHMTHIPYEGEVLHSLDRVEWTVTLWDENGVPGEPMSASFELGLLEPTDWKAQWISGIVAPKKGRRYPVDCFKKEFSAKKAVNRARLYATARGVYDVTLNGARLAEHILAPGITDYRKRIQVQTYDVTALVAESNALELRLADGWFRGSSAAYGVVDVYGRQTSVIAQLEITYEDGTTETVITDETWAWSNDGPIRFADLKDGEVYDARMTPTYRGNAKVVEGPKGMELCASDNVPVREHERFAPTRDGQILDFGQNIAGYLEFTVKGRPGQMFTLRMGEVVHDGHVDLSGIQERKPTGGWTQTAMLKKLLTGKAPGETVGTPLQEIRFTCSGGVDHYKTSFAVFGFRYAEIIGEVDFENISAIAVYSDMERTGSFQCSDARVNRLLENTLWSMKGNFLDIPTDCPTRERLGWTGDAQIFFDTGAYLMDTAAFFRKWLRDMRDSQYKNSLLSAVLPYEGVEMMYKSTGSSAGWADAVYLIPWRYYLRYGDREMLETCWPMIRKFAEYLLKSVDKDGHYEKGIHLGEWLEPEEFRDQVYGAQAKHPEECTAYLYLAMTTMAEIAELLEPEYAVKLRQAAERAKSVYPKYAELDTDRQAKLVRPLALGLLDGETKKNAQARLKKAVENYNYRVGTGFLSTPFLLPVLTEAGEIETAYKMLLNTEKPGWLVEVLDGATTVWENWEGDLSQNHYSPGAVCQWLFDTCAGIRVTGERSFRIAPTPGPGLDHASAEYLSPYGPVSSAWERTESGTHYKIAVPANCTAQICVGGRTETVTAGVYEYDE